MTGGWGIANSYGFQCKAFADDLGKTLGAPLTSGNALVLAQVLAPGWSWVSDPQPGDLAVRNYWGYDNQGVRTNFGDVVGIKAVNGTTLITIGQNQESVSLEYGHVPTEGVHHKSEFIKFLRRNYEEAPMPDNGIPDDSDIINAKRAITGDPTYQPTGPEFDYYKQVVDGKIVHGWHDLAYDIILGMQARIDKAASQVPNGFELVTEKLYREKTK